MLTVTLRVVRSHDSTTDAIKDLKIELLTEKSRLLTQRVKELEKENFQLHLQAIDERLADIATIEKAGVDAADSLVQSLFKKPRLT